MKCPKCGYNSFEYLDSCKKCNADLVSFKVTHGIRATILPAMALATSGGNEEKLPDFSSPLVPPPLQESDEFSWDDSPEEQINETGAFPAMGLDLPPNEPDHFNFNLDLPDSETASEAKETVEETFGGFGTEGNDFFKHAEPEESVQENNEEPALQEETPFGELSFEDLYGGEEAPAAPADSAADEPLPDFFGAADAPAEEPVADDVFGSLLEIERNADGTAPGTPPSAFDADPFQVEETISEEPASQEEAGEGDVDLMGLSPAEYESLFGEPPKKKK